MSVYVKDETIENFHLRTINNMKNDIIVDYNVKNEKINKEKFEDIVKYLRDSAENKDEKILEKVEEILIERFFR